MGARYPTNHPSDWRYRRTMTTTRHNALRSASFTLADRAARAKESSVIAAKVHGADFEIDP
jgi:hypothetical protein